MNYKMYIEKKVSSKTKNEYTALYIDLGYRKVAITMEDSIIADIADMKMSEIFNIKVDTPLEIGSFIRKPNC